MHMIITADDSKNRTEIEAIFGEYLDWVIEIVNQNYGGDFSVSEYLAQDMLTLKKFMPPSGRIFLSQNGNSVSGIVCLKRLTPQIGEIKRMYVRPQFRKMGIGHLLVEKVIEESLPIGYQKLRLDSARFMSDAHALYPLFGFFEIEPYEGSEIPKDFQIHWKFMEKALRSFHGGG